ncbi:hypothetical protein EON64_17445, partial [archaeon]
MCCVLVAWLSEVLAGRFDAPRALVPFLVLSVLEVSHTSDGGAILRLCDRSAKIVAHMDEAELQG